ncbi:MAG: hypothetical protein LBP40_04900 [Campylobacteraceae bacterium]|nr:hypothetical protein [Campylobacteraceae bacterium]
MQKCKNPKTLPFSHFAIIKEFLQKNDICEAQAVVLSIPSFPFYRQYHSHNKTTSEYLLSVIPERTI